jgi:hypothetical protein
MPSLSWLGLIVALTVAVASAEQRSVDDILSLDGTALFAAAKKVDVSEFSSRDLIRIAKKLSAERNNIGKDDLNRYALGSFFEHACKKADVNELAEVIQLYVALDPQSFEKFLLLPPLAARWIHEELKSISSGSLPRKQSSDVAVPAELENAPTELVNAWKIFKQATGSYDLKFERRPDVKMIDFQSNKRAFYGLVDQLLLKQGEGSAKKLANFGWTRMCGTGYELSDPQSLTIFMALFRERRIEEAIGAAIYIQDHFSRLTRDIGVRIEFLKKYGVDWELVFAGAQLDYENSVPPRRHGEYLRALVRYGSDRAASLAVKMAKRTKPERRTEYAAALAAFFTRSNAPEGSSSAVSRVPEGKVSEETKSEIIHVLQEFATPDTPKGVVEPALQVFRCAKLPETIGTLRDLTKHPSPEVAQAAANILISMGEEVVLSSPLKPVCFQILVNGAPIGGDTLVVWSASGTAGGMVSRAGKPKQNGIIEIAREYFLDHERKPKSVVFEMGPTESPCEPFFHVSVSVPANLDSITRVNVDLQPMELTIHGPRDTLPGTEQKATIRIKRDRGEVESVIGPVYYRIWRTFDAPAEQPISLMLQPGGYELEILLPGAERYARMVAVDARSPSVDAQLRPGADVRVEAVRSDDQQIMGGSYVTGPNSEAKLNYYQDENGTFRGLPYGDYVLHIPGSAHSRDPVFIDAVNYAGREIPFTIPENSPPLVELGTIRLDPVAK